MWLLRWIPSSCRALATKSCSVKRLWQVGFSWRSERLKKKRLKCFSFFEVFLYVFDIYFVFLPCVFLNVFHIVWYSCQLVFLEVLVVFLGTPGTLVGGCCNSLDLRVGFAVVSKVIGCYIDINLGFQLVLWFVGFRFIGACRIFDGLQWLRGREPRSFEKTCWFLQPQKSTTAKYQKQLLVGSLDVIQASKYIFGIQFLFLHGIPSTSATLRGSLLVLVAIGYRINTSETQRALLRVWAWSSDRSCG